MPCRFLGKMQGFIFDFLKKPTVGYVLCCPLCLTSHPCGKYRDSCYLLQYHKAALLISGVAISSFQPLSSFSLTLRKVPRLRKHLRCFLSLTISGICMSEKNSESSQMVVKVKDTSFYLLINSQILCLTQHFFTII